MRLLAKLCILKRDYEDFRCTHCCFGIRTHTINIGSTGRREALDSSRSTLARRDCRRGTGTSGAQGIQTIVLQGDPTKPGLYTIRLKIASNLRIQAHLHQDLRSAVVVSGTWYFGYGHTFDEKALKELPAGSFYTEPANVDHFAMTKGEVIVQITGYGPTSTKYFDPELDPSRKK